MSQIDTEVTPCPVCGASNFALRYCLRDWAYEVPGEFQFVTCLQCGHIYQTPRPTQAAIGAFYPADYQPFRRAIDEEPHPWIRAWRHIQWRARCLQVARLRRGGRLLDVGASTGLFLNEMRRYGPWTLAGIEPDARAAQYARDTFQLDMFAGQLEDAPWSAASFDVITFWDVLEHLPNPRAALVKASQLLADDGWLIVAVPNAGSLDAQLFGRYWIGLDPPRHMSVFSPKTLRRLLLQTDFVVEAAYCFYGRYTTFALSARQWLHAHLRRSRLRQGIDRIIFLPVWRFLSLPYFWVVDQLGLGAILTVRARPTATK